MLFNYSNPHAVATTTPSRACLPQQGIFNILVNRSRLHQWMEEICSHSSQPGIDSSIGTTLCSPSEALAAPPVTCVPQPSRPLTTVP